MLCKVCNTRVVNGRTTCPNCGSNSLIDSPKNQPKASSLPQAAFSVPDEPDPTVKDDAVELEVPAEVEDMTDSMVDVESENEVEPSDAAAEVLDLVETEIPGSALEVDSDGVRRMLVEQPDLLEAGLTVYTSEKGTPQGIGYTSAVGEIDLLAWDSKGGLVVVMVADETAGAELVSEMLQRIGWVSKHLCGTEQSVRGVVLLAEMPESVIYAAAAVSETVTFKTWRFALSFDDIQS
jgi:uncharacterized Zn finger protein (UPF0148 family)